MTTETSEVADEKVPEPKKSHKANRKIPLPPSPRERITASTPARLEAQGRLGIDEKAAMALPSISHLIRQIPGRQKAALEFLRGSSDPLSTQFFSVYDSVSKSDQKSLTIEDFCCAASISPTKLFGVIVAATVEQSGQLGNVIAAAAHPRIVQATIMAAGMERGFEDRRMMLQHARFLPTPKGSTISIAAQFNGGSSSSVPADSSVTLPPMSEDIRELNDKFNQRSLGPGTPAQPSFSTPVMEGELVEMERES